MPLQTKEKLELSVAKKAIKEILVVVPEAMVMPVAKKAEKMMHVVKKTKKMLHAQVQTILVMIMVVIIMVVIHGKVLVKV